MNRDYSSIYTTKDFFQKVIPLYFNKDELSLSTVGALGMFLDINGSVTEDMINIAARYINEQMPGQAELPDFIYANAANMVSIMYSEHLQKCLCFYWLRKMMSSIIPNRSETIKNLSLTLI